MGIKDETGDSAVKLSISLCSVNLLENHLAVRTRQLECAVGKPLILIFFHKTDSGCAGIADPGNKIDCRSRLAFNNNLLTDCNDRVQNGPMAAGKRTCTIHSFRLCNGISPADKLQTISLVRNLNDIRVP